MEVYLSVLLLLVIQIQWISASDEPSFGCGFDDNDLIVNVSSRSPHSTGRWFRWIDGKINYYFKGNVKEGDKELTRSIMREIESHTCFKYIEHNTEPAGHHLEIVVEAPTCFRNGFSAYVQPQSYTKVLLRSFKQLTDHESCDNRGGFMHEMMHALGVGHTQKRADRDKYIILNDNNIEKMSQYDVCEECRLYKDVPYDCSSIMHYGQGTFSVGGGRPTMRARNPETCKLSWNGPAFDVGQPAQSDWKLLEIIAGQVCDMKKSKWLPWSEWSACSEPCGDGRKSRKRTCTGAGKCEGESQQVAKCSLQDLYENPEECPAWKSHCAGGKWKDWMEKYCARTCTCGGGEAATWSSWGEWSGCSASCGDGIKTRSRTCSVSGKCPGDSQQTNKCDLPKCVSCFEHDIHHVGFGLYKPGGDNNYGATGSAEGCQSVCQKTTGCAWFNWVRKQDECWLKTEKGNRIKQMPGDVSGPRTCQTGTGTGTGTGSDDLDQLCSRGHDVGKRNFQIVDKINQYRSEIGRSQLKCVGALVSTAKHHTRNQMDVNPSTGGCNLHSWLSSKHLGKGGKKCCYKSNHSRPNCMWKKPGEILGWDGGNGFEISYASGGGAGPDEAFKGWRRSSGHNNVMASNGMWKSLTKVGCYYEGNYANCWFAM